MSENSGNQEEACSDLRTALIESHAVAVAILLLIFWSISNLFYGLAQPAQSMLVYVGTAVAILDIPTAPSVPEMRIIALYSSNYLIAALVEFCAAWVLSKTVYRAGPIAALRRVQIGLKGFPDA